MNKINNTEELSSLNNSLELEHLLLEQKDITIKKVWKKISKIDGLPVEIMRRYKDNLDWVTICKHQRLSEKTVLEFINYIDWKGIIKYQRFSNKFLSQLKELIPRKNRHRKMNNDVLKQNKKGRNKND